MLRLSTGNSPRRARAGARPHWTSYISVEDADATAARAGELGGAAVFCEPFDVLDAGRVAAISDPAGAIVSLWQPRSRIGAMLVDDVGALCWNELATTDVAWAKTFFGELLASSGRALGRSLPRERRRTSDAAGAASHGATIAAPRLSNRMR